MESLEELELALTVSRELSADAELLDCADWVLLAEVAPEALASAAVADVVPPELEVLPVEAAVALEVVRGLAGVLAGTAARWLLLILPIDISTPELNCLYHRYRPGFEELEANFRWLTRRPMHRATAW